MTRGGAGSRTDDAEYLRSVAAGYRLSQVVYVFATLGVADVLVDGPAPVEAVAERTGSHAPSLRRLLRMATAMELVAEPRPDWFALAPRGQLLRSDVDDSLWPRACSIGESWHWGPWGKLLHTVRTGEPAFTACYGVGSFQFFDQNPHAGDAFTRRMTIEARRRGAVIAQVADFSAARCVVDVGGGTGGILAAILARHPHTTGILLDLPYSLTGAEAVLAAAGVADRVRVVAGDLREGVPEGGDVYLLSAILHSWSDADAIRLLAACLHHANRVIVVDEVVDESNRSPELLLKDLQMLVNTPGRQRSEAEFRALFEAAGADLVRVTPTGTGDTILEGHPARWRRAVG